MNLFQKALIACSATVEDIIALPRCRADAKRHAMIGAFVLLTACFAFASGGFAVYTGFHSVPMAVAFGVPWALMIFTIDRFVVSGIRKADVEGLNLPARLRIRGKEWLITAPRIALAALISLVIVTPLELRFFEREIDAQIAASQLAAVDGARTAIDAGFADVAALQQENRRLAEETAAAREKARQMHDVAAQELGGGGVTGVKGPGIVFREREKQAAQLDQDWRDTQRANDVAIRRNDAEIARLDQRRQAMVNARTDVISKSDGFLARYEALGQLASRHSDIRTARSFMTLLFLCIELTPVLMKALFNRGPYDEILETLEHSVHVEQLKARSDLNDDAHADVILHSLRNQRRIAAEEELTRALSDLDTITQAAPDEYEEAKRRLAKATIQDWTRNQMAGRGLRVNVRTPP